MIGIGSNGGLKEPKEPREPKTLFGLSFQV